MPIAAPHPVRTVPLSAAVLVLCIASVLLYGGSLHNAVVFDDVGIIGNAEKIHAGLASRFQLRWFPYFSITFAWTHLAADISWLRAGNLTLHVAASLALFALLRRLIPLVEPTGPQKIPADRVALASALLFSVHPAAVYGVAYLIQRSIVMATLFSLLCLMTYLQGLVQKRPAWFLLSAACYFVAVFSKEHSVMVPAVALAMTMLIRKPSRALAKEVALPFCLYTLIGSFVVWSTRGLLGIPYEPEGARLLWEMFGQDLPANAHLLSAITQGYLYFKYAVLWFIPNPAWISIDMREPFASGLTAWPHALGFIAFLAYGLAGIWMLFSGGRRALVGFFLLYPWLLFAPEFSAIRIQEPFVLYRSYLWGAGFTTLCALALFHCPRYVAVALLSIALALLTLAGTNRLASMTSNLTLWDDAEKLVRANPSASFPERIYFNRGNAFFDVRQYRQAIEDYTTAIGFRPNVAAIHNNRGFAHLELRQPREALADFDAAIARHPAHGRAHIGRGIALEMIGLPVAAAEAFRQSCTLGYPATCRKWQELAAQAGLPARRLAD